MTVFAFSVCWLGSGPTLLMPEHTGVCSRWSSPQHLPPFLQEHLLLAQIPLAWARAVGCRREKGTETSQRSCTRALWLKRLLVVVG